MNEWTYYIISQLKTTTFPANYYMLANVTILVFYKDVTCSIEGVKIPDFKPKLHPEELQWYQPQNAECNWAMHREWWNDFKYTYFWQNLSSYLVAVLKPTIFSWLQCLSFQFNLNFKYHFKDYMGVPKMVVPNNHGFSY